jgi:isopenicillin N synthase-like dioxygenase
MKIAQVDFLSKTAGEDFKRSLHETGFAVIQNHRIHKELIENTYKDWEMFFSSPSKFDYLFDPAQQSGYFPFKSENAKEARFKDLKEFFHLYPDTALPVGLSSNTFVLRTELVELGRILLSWLQEFSLKEVVQKFSLPLPQMVEKSTRNLFRILHYPPLGDGFEAGAIRAAAHEDINLITLLPAATAPGLEVLDIQGNWHSVPCDPGSIVVNAGDMLQLASDGYFRSTTHRVVNPQGEGVKKSRYSMPFFLHPRKEVDLRAGFTADEYLKQRLREIGLLV